ncbi:MAG: lipoprotein [Marinobacter sp.]
MQVGPWRRPRCAALILAVLMVAGCGQKGPLYRDHGVSEAEPASTVDQPGQTGTTNDDEAPAGR